MHEIKEKIEVKKKQHYCNPFPEVVRSFKCISIPDTNKYFDLIWIDGSRLMVEYCPFCGESASNEH